MSGWLTSAMKNTARRLTGQRGQQDPGHVAERADHPVLWSADEDERPLRCEHSLAV